jgi:glycerophosphoryl diester phosphodiesterase
MTEHKLDKIKTLFIGHRGARALVDENTIESITKGISFGVHMVEFDIRKTKDGKFILMHDKTIDRATSGTGRVSDLTLDEISKIKTKNGYNIPVFGEVLGLLKEKGILGFIDTKDNADFEEKFAVVLEKYNFANDCIVDTERPETVNILKSINPALKLAISPTRMTRYLDDPVKYIKSCGADYLDMPHEQVTKPLVEALHENGLKVTVWVANDKKRIKELTDMGVDGIMSDYPNLFLGG